MAPRAVVCVDKTDFKTWKIEPTEKPTAPEGHVVVKMILASINPTDILSPSVFLSGKDRVVPGIEGVGIVEEVGANVTKVKKGQRVAPSFLKLFIGEGKGSWQDYAVVPEEDLHIPPESLSDETAAFYPLNPFTVYGLLLEQNLSAGDYLLQGAASSVLGRMIIQLAKHWGIKTINIVRRDNVIEELKELGADEVINSSKEDILERVKEITGGELADGALDPVAGAMTKVMASCVKTGGKCLIYGVLGTDDNTATVGIFDLGRVHMRFWQVYQLIEDHTQEVLAEKVSKLLEDKVMVPLIGKTFKLEEFKEAIIESEKPGRGGKVFLRL